MFVGLYRQPTGSFDNFCTFLEKILIFASENKFELVLGGDFNINMLDNGLKQTFLLALVALNGFDIISTGLTRVTAASSTLLDFFITNLLHLSIQADVITTDISDHLAVFMLLDSTDKHKKGKNALFRIFWKII